MYPFMISETAYQEYLEALVSGNHAECSSLVEHLLEEEIPLVELYTDLFRRSLYDVGLLWEKNRISVAVEHMATAITERLLALVYPRIFRADHVGKRAIVTCTPGEHHQIGARMVADTLELHGWDGYFLGADTPRDGLFALVQEKKPDLLALSASIVSNIDSAWAVLEELQANYPSLPVIVGGQAFTDRREELSRRFPRVRHVGTLEGLQQMICDGKPK